MSIFDTFLVQMPVIQSQSNRRAYDSGAASRTDGIASRVANVLLTGKPDPLRYQGADAGTAIVNSYG